MLSSDNPNSRDQDGFTPLMHAAWKGQHEKINELIQAGARINARNGYGSTALFWAAESGRVDIVEQLITNGAEILIINHNGHNPITWAQACGQLKIAHKLHETVLQYLIDRLHQTQDPGESSSILAKMKAHHFTKASLVDYLVNLPLPRDEKINLINRAVAVDEAGKPNNYLSEYLHQTQIWGPSYAVCRLKAEIFKISLSCLDTSPKLR